MVSSSEDFSFPKISNPLPHFAILPSLWRVSSIVYPDYNRDERDDHVGRKNNGEKIMKKSFSSWLETKRDDHESSRTETEDRMDVLWEDFNEELESSSGLQLVSSYLDIKKRSSQQAAAEKSSSNVIHGFYHDISDQSAASTDDLMKQQQQLCCMQSKPTGRGNNNRISTMISQSSSSNKRRSNMVFKVWKKIFLLYNSSSSAAHQMKKN